MEEVNPVELPVLTRTLAAQILQSETDYLTSRIQSILERKGNPEGVEIARFGNAAAFYIRTMPWALFNSVKGLSDEDSDQLEAILQFYRSRDRAFQIDIDPVRSGSRLFTALAEKGLHQTGFHSVLYGLPKQEPPASQSNIKITEITQPSEFDSFAEIHCLGSGMPLSAKPHFMNNNIGLLNRPGWKLFLATLDDVPAGVAVMHISGSIASCTLAATAPEYRNRGIQTALIQRRLYEAHFAGCQLVAAQASFGSTSQNNLERAGFQIAWTRSVWG